MVRAVQGNLQVSNPFMCASVRLSQPDLVDASTQAEVARVRLVTTDPLWRNSPVLRSETAVAEFSLGYARLLLFPSCVCVSCCV